MSTSGVSPETQKFIDIIEQAEQRSKDSVDFFKSLQRRLSKTKRALTKKPAVAAEVSKLIDDLQEMRDDPEKASAARLPQLIEALRSSLHALEVGRRQDFPSELQQACRSASLDFVPLPDGFGIGPFRVTVNWDKETASFEFAKTVVLKNVAANPIGIAENAAALKTQLLDAPVDFKKFRAELLEAMRVALARQGKPIDVDRLRADLPSVFQEMVLIRETRRKRKSDPEYTVARFVVELKQLIQSDENLNAQKQFRPETAVIERTKNPKKSLFVPRDLNRGYGEGTYFQAIVFA